MPSGAVPLAAFIIDDGGATLQAPLQVSFTGIAAPASGQSILISGFNANAYADVSTTTYASGTISTAANVDYPGISLASSTIYVLYTVPTANVVAPTATITVAGLATVATGAQNTYAANETTTNGFPFFGHTFTYGLTSGTLGTIVATSGVFTAGGVGGTGSVTATDTAVTSFTGSASVSVTSARPGVAGVTQQYTGTLTEIDANNIINGSSPPPAQTTVSKTTLAVTSATDSPDTSGSQTGVIFTANETDASNLTTLTSTTTSTVLYQQNGGTTNVVLKKTVANESSGVTYEHDYGEPGGSGTVYPITTILPETAQTFSNDAYETYLETDPGVSVSSGTQQVTTTKNIAADGTYSATYLEPSVFTGSPTTDTAVEGGTNNSPFSGVLTLASVEPTFTVVFAAPTNGSITFSFIDPNLNLNIPNTVPSYIPASATQPSVETDTITPGQPLAAGCTNSATYATANQIVQSKTIVDVIYGTVETKTLTSYDVNSVGTVCTVLADTINTFYDYSGQEGPYSLGLNFLIYPSNSATVPALTTTVSEALSLQSTAASQSAGRAAQSLGTAGPAFVLPVEAVAAHIEYLAHRRMLDRLAAFRQSVSLKIRGGSVK